MLRGTDSVEHMIQLDRKVLGSSKPECCQEEVIMNVSPRIPAITATVTLLTLLTMPNRAAPQGLTSLLATAKGQGTLTVGNEVFTVSNVVVKLKEDGTAEVTVVTDLQLFVAGRWSAPEDQSQG